MNSLNKYLFIIIFLALGSGGFAQSKINFPLRMKISDPEKQNQILHLTVRGNPEKIKSFLRDHSGVYKYAYHPSKINSVKEDNAAWSFITIPVQYVEKLSKQDFVEEIEYIYGKPQVLNDTLKINMNANAVHEGLSPLLQSYDGTGVLIGIIDLGIELTHPDFLDSLGRTRVVSLWDQTIDTANPFFDPWRAPLPYGYGQVWDSSDINGGFHHHAEQSYGHGSHVTGIAAGDGSSDSIPVFKGMAPNANLIVVSSNFDLEVNDWLQTIADAVTFIFEKADAMNKPCVINISAGTYAGSHDGKDIVAQYINDLISFKNGRAVVCAAGNAGNAPLMHLRTTLSSESKFTWFKKNNSFIVPGYAPGGGVYFELYADTADFNNINFSFGADNTSPYQLRGTSPSFNIKNLFNNNYPLDANGIYSDTLKNSLGQRLSKIYFAADTINNGETYLLYVLLSPDSSQYYYRFNTSGTGKFDVWSAEWLGFSDMVYDSLPSFSLFPDIINYSLPDNQQTIVSSFTCAPNVITVGNYTNRNYYISYFGNKVYAANDSTLFPGTIFPSSSKGPTRDGRTKPDITAPGGPVLSAGKFYDMNYWKNSGNDQLAQGGMHFENSGTSMSSPAVAGLAALYFQKCPGAGFADLYTALIQNSRTDSITGSVPNNTWGYGKADAFQTLISSNFNVALLNPDSVACPGPVVLGINGVYPFYQWSNGSVSSNIIASQSGNYFATVINQKGCKARTDTVKINIDPSIPSPPITITGNPFFCDGDSVNLSYPDTFVVYQWSNGKSLSSIYIDGTGFYKVTATAVNGCRYPSDSVLTWSKSNPPLPEIFQDGDTLNSTPANNYQWYFNGNALAEDTLQDIIADQSGYYQVEVFHVNGCSTISDSVFVMNSGEEDFVNGNAGLKIFPNPNDGSFELRIANGFEFTNSAYHKIKIYNILGEVVSEVKIADNTKMPLQINLGNGAAGVYYLMIRAEGKVFTEKLIVQPTNN